MKNSGSLVLLNRFTSGVGKAYLPELSLESESLSDEALSLESELSD